MSTGLVDKNVTYIPFGERSEITLSFGQVKNFISAKTRKGMTATDADIIKFMMLCKARELNPWVGDAYLVGYDSQDGPTFSLITSIQALFKRAEANPMFDGLESGVIVRCSDGTMLERQGDFVMQDEKLLGGWARCYRKDRKIPFYDALNLSTYDKGRSQWEKDKSGMICKTAEASVLRKAFPSQLSALYTQQEEAAIISQSVTAHSLDGQTAASRPKTISDLVANKPKLDPPKPQESVLDVACEVPEPQHEEQTVPSSKPAAKKSKASSLFSYSDDDPIGVYLNALSMCNTVEDCRNCYEQHGNPDRNNWSPADDTRAVQMRDARIAQLKGE